MARGWESKSVESQQEAAEDRTAQRRPMTDREQSIEALELSRKHLMDEIEASSNPRFQELKQKALLYLDQKLEALRRAP